MRIGKGVAGMCCVVLGGILLSGGPATAAVVPAQPGAVAGTASVEHRVVEVALKRGGFDANVARAHGYTVAVDAHGVAYGTKPGYRLRYDRFGAPYASPAIMPATAPASEGGVTAYGDCGSSFMYFNAIGGLRAQVYTGFNIGLPTTQVNWKVRVIDAAGTGVVTASPHGGTYASWNVIFYTTNHVGEASAEVYPGSFAVETNGSICYSGSPKDYTRIYD